jgi:hypothetical protein
VNDRAQLISRSRIEAAETVADVSVQRLEVDERKSRLTNQAAFGFHNFSNVVDTTFAAVAELLARKGN